jgi:uncharacterized protein YbaP (TraB family)
MRRALCCWVWLLWLAAACAQAADVPRGLLWEVRSDRGTVFLLGTIHVGNASLYPLPPSVEEAYRASSRLAVEADVASGDAAAAARSAIYTPPDALDRHVPAAIYQDVTDAARDLGVPMDIARRMKPPMLAMALTMIEVSRIGMEPRFGIDLHFSQRAKADGKELVELESVAQQIAMLDALSPDAQVAMLQATLRGIRSGSLTRDMDALIEAWKRGDAERVDEIATQDLRAMPAGAADALEKALYEDRNRAMAEKIAALLAREEITLVAVGAGHMTGPTGLVTLLKARGYSVLRR